MSGLADNSLGFSAAGARDRRAALTLLNPAAVRGNCVTGTFDNGWHTFGADWEPRSITYYYDGRVVRRIRSGITHAPM